MALTNPFKGPQPYQENDTFYGRDAEVGKLYEYVRLNTLTLLYAKSGFGKTSLIKAGLMNKLKESLHYVPIYIRINSLQHRSTDDLKELIRRQIAEFKTANEGGAFTTLGFDESKATGAASIFEYLYSISLTATNKFYQHVYREQLKTPTGEALEYPLIPVLIFDQFEEIFTILKDNPYKDTLLSDLRCLLEDELPPSLKEKIEHSEQTEDILFYSRLTEKAASKDKFFRVIFSFREEFLISLETLKEIIPSIIFTSARFRLEAFSVAEARTVITHISREKIQPDIATRLAQLLASESPGRTVDSPKTISPFILSLVCFELYPLLTQQESVATRTPEEKQAAIAKELATNGKSRIRHAIKKYYEEALQDISPDTKKFVEEKLVSKDDKRTLFPYNDISIYFNSKEKNKQLLTEINRLIEDPSKRYISKNEYLNTPHIEILHDQLLLPVVTARNQRIKKERSRKNILRLSVGVFALLLLFMVFRYGSLIESIKTKYEHAKKEGKEQLALLEKEHGPYPAFLKALQNAAETNGFLQKIPFYSYDDSLRQLDADFLHQYYSMQPLWGAIDTAKIKGFYNYKAYAGPLVSPDGSVALSFNETGDKATIVELDSLRVFPIALNDTAHFNVVCQNDDFAFGPNTLYAAFTRQYLAFLINYKLFILDRKNHYTPLPPIRMSTCSVTNLFTTLDESLIVLETHAPQKGNVFIYELFTPQGNKIDSFRLANNEVLLNLATRADGTKKLITEFQNKDTTALHRYPYPFSKNSKPELVTSVTALNTQLRINAVTQRYFFYKEKGSQEWSVYDAQTDQNDNKQLLLSNPDEAPVCLVKADAKMFFITAHMDSSYNLTLPAVLLKSPNAGDKQYFLTADKADLPKLQIKDIYFPGRADWLAISYIKKEKEAKEGPSSKVFDSLYVSLINLKTGTMLSPPFPIASSPTTALYLFSERAALLLPAPSPGSFPYISFIKKPEEKEIALNWDTATRYRWGLQANTRYAYGLDELRKMDLH